MFCVPDRFVWPSVRSRTILAETGAAGAGPKASGLADTDPASDAGVGDTFDERDVGAVAACGAGATGAFEARTPVLATGAEDRTR